MELRTLLYGQSPVLGVMLSEFENPNIVRIFQQAGFQYLIVDDEHGYFDYSRVAALIAVASGHSFPVIVRVPGVSREYITKVLDMGASGILVPMVDTPEQARQVVSYSKYAPVGHRGVSTTRAHTNYAPPPLKEYLQDANRRVLTMIQLETKQAVSNAASIAQIEGIDALFIGPNDLACDLGIPGEVSNPLVQEAAAQVAEIGRQAQKPVGIITSNSDLTAFCRNCGFTLFSSGSELDLLLKGAKARVREFFASQPT